MSQRRIAASIAIPLLGALLLVAVLVPVPFASYHPGPTFDVLGDDRRRRDHPGERRQDLPRRRPDPVHHGLGLAGGGRKNIFEVLVDWVDPDSAVYPYDIVHPPGTTAEQEEAEGQVQMVSSQDNAIAAALPSWTTR